MARALARAGLRPEGAARRCWLPRTWSALLRGPAGPHGSQQKEAELISDVRRTRGPRPAGDRHGRAALPAFSMGPWQPWDTCQGGAGFSPRGVWPPAGRGLLPLGELRWQVFTLDVGLQRNIVLKLRWP